MHDIVIIGAGVVGASIARKLSGYQLDIALLEARPDVAEGSSGANSAIVHAGYDCTPGSMMAKLNVIGNAMYDAIKAELDVPFIRTGSLMLALDHGDLEELGRLLVNGEKNGVTGLEILSPQQAVDMEPNLNNKMTAALWAPSAGITCPYELTLAMAENAVENGVEVYFNHKVTAIVKQDGLFRIETTGGEFKARYLINCAGVYADDISCMAGGEDFTIRPRKGEYSLYDRKFGNMVSRVIFQCPDKMGKGVLVTPTVDGNLLIGPSALDTDNKEDTDTTAPGQDFIYKKAIQSVPSLTRNGIIGGFAGLRAIASTGDFIIEASKKVDAFINVAGISSPGLTAAPAIAIEVAAILSEIGCELAAKENFSPYRKGIPRVRELDVQELNNLIEQDSSYGRIVCRCEMVTEGQIKDAINSSLPPATLDAVKRRTRAGMGRCQGGFCVPRVMDILRKQAGLQLDQITKRGGQSKIALGKIKEI